MSSLVKKLLPIASALMLVASASVSRADIFAPPSSVNAWGNVSMGSSAVIVTLSDSLSAANQFSAAHTDSTTATRQDLLVGSGSSLYDANSMFFLPNPQIQGSNAFNLAMSGISSQTTVDGVTFQFSLGENFHIAAAPVVTPEPSSLLLLGTGILGAGFLVRWRAKAAHAKA